MHRNEELCRRWAEEVWNEGREDSIDEMFAEDGQAVYPYFIVGDDTLTGRENFKKFFREVRRQIRDLRVRMSDVQVEDDRVVAIFEISGRINVNGEHDGRHVAIRSLCMYKIDNGLIREIWNNVELDESEVRNYRLKIERNEV